MVRLYERHIEITDDKTGAVLYSNERTVHDLKSYVFNVAWPTKVTDWTNAMAIVTANHDSQKIVKTVKIEIWV